MFFIKIAIPFASVCSASALPFLPVTTIDFTLSKTFVVDDVDKSISLDFVDSNPDLPNEEAVITTNDFPSLLKLSVNNLGNKTIVATNHSFSNMNNRLEKFQEEHKKAEKVVAQKVRFNKNVESITQKIIKQSDVYKKQVENANTSKNINADAFAKTINKSSFLEFNQPERIESVLRYFFFYQSLLDQVKKTHSIASNVKTLLQALKTDIHETKIIFFVKEENKKQTLTQKLEKIKKIKQNTQDINKSNTESEKHIADIKDLIKNITIKITQKRGSSHSITKYVAYHDPTSTIQKEDVATFKVAA